MRVPQPSRFVRRTILTVGLIAVVSQMVSLGACCCPHQATGPCPVMSVAALRFDGVYQRTTTDSTVDRNTYWYYIRFYADGRVLTVTTSAPWRFAAWFNWDEPGRSVGHFDRRGDRLAFSAFQNEALQRDGNGGGQEIPLGKTLPIDDQSIAGFVAPLVGKQPPDSHVWILEGEAPAFVKSEQPLYNGGPLWRIELVSPTWPRGASQ